MSATNGFCTVLLDTLPTPDEPSYAEISVLAWDDLLWVIAKTGSYKCTTKPIHMHFFWTTPALLTCSLTGDFTITAELLHIDAVTSVHQVKFQIVFTASDIVSTFRIVGIW